MELYEVALADNRRTHRRRLAGKEDKDESTDEESLVAPEVRETPSSAATDKARKEAAKKEAGGELLQSSLAQMNATQLEHVLQLISRLQAGLRRYL